MKQTRDFKRLGRYVFSKFVFYYQECTNSLLKPRPYSANNIPVCAS